jgi:hypothetical protein
VDATRPILRRPSLFAAPFSPREAPDITVLSAFSTFHLISRFALNSQAHCALSKEQQTAGTGVQFDTGWRLG